MLLPSNLKCEPVDPRAQLSPPEELSVAALESLPLQRVPLQLALHLPGQTLRSNLGGAKSARQEPGSLNDPPHVKVN